MHLAEVEDRTEPALSSAPAEQSRAAQTALYVAICAGAGKACYGADLVICAPRNWILPLDVVARARGIDCM